MKVALSLLCCLAVGVLIWALLPPEVERPPVSRAPAAATTTGAAAEPASGDEPPSTRRAPPAAATTPTRGSAPPARPAGPGPDLRPPAVPLPEGEYRTAAQGGAGRTPDMPVPRTTFSAFKDPMRRYYGNLPRTGRMPARVVAEEILSDHLIRALGVPPTSQVVELGHHPTTGPEGFEEALAIEGQYPVMFGVTVVTPDGQRIRDYVQVAPDAE